MKKILVILTFSLLSCNVHSPKKKEFRLKLYFLGGHERTMTFDLPTDAHLYIKQDPVSICWQSDNWLCGEHIIKYNVIDFEIINK